jgi:hypothetical protein
MRFASRPHALTRVAALAAIGCLLVACGGRPASDDPGAASPALPVQVSLGEIPEDARISNGGPNPRSPEYWIAWSTCGAGSQAATAAANGGRAAGWILVDDLLVDPGIALGDHAVPTCAEAVRVLTGAPLGLATDSDAAALAREVITAVLNLLAGAETCEGAEAAVAVGQSLLATIGYGQASTERQPGSRERALIAEATTTLVEYSRGTLCR